METHTLSLHFSCPLNADITVMALNPSLGFLTSWCTSGPPHVFEGLMSTLIGFAATPPQLRPATEADWSTLEREAALHY